MIGLETGLYSTGSIYLDQIHSFLLLKDRMQVLGEGHILYELSPKPKHLGRVIDQFSDNLNEAHSHNWFEIQAKDQLMTPTATAMS